ncbi:MAG: AAA family ATPase [Candidatus Gorgyraea atricola]|nr:AAA family ATPase [Candidatus Gorgyraea atricola]
MYEQFWEERIQNVEIVGNQIKGDCPICDKERHFYASIDTGQFDCKSCGIQGNAITYLRDYEHKNNNQITECLKSCGINGNGYVLSTSRSNIPCKYFDEGLVERYVNNISNDKLKEFAQERGLPVEVLKKYKIGINERGEFSLPVYDIEGKIRDIRRKRIGSDTISSAGAEVFLFGIEDLLLNNRIFVTEGEWSKMALEVQGYPSIGVPGASILKDEWVTYFMNKEVNIVYDLDSGGENGTKRLIKKLKSIAKEIKVIHLPKELGEGKDIRDFFNNGGSKEQFEELIRQAEIVKCGESIPLSLSEFMKQDIPPLEFYISDLLPKKGKGMVSAQANIGKSILSQNLALAMASGKENFLGKFSISPARVLYLDLEMGESALKERFQKMRAQENLTVDNLFVKYLPSLNLLKVQDNQLLERWITDLKIEVLIIDPLGNAWLGNENEQEQVSRLTAYLNNLIDKYKISILINHHWRKSTKAFRTGGQMAAGSYRWEAWLDCHITLEGTSAGITVSNQKNRNRSRFRPFITKINEQNLWFEFLADYENKFDENTLLTLFDSFGLEKVAIPKLIKQAKEQRICSETTLRKLLKDMTLFRIDKEGKTHYLIKKDLLNDISS